ncbi:MAG: DUF308 domain-containing protein, partial [Pseudomonadota bacterium]|nr:DUF308 domain-containing protein [Pseudomonadota bacterium]
MADEIKAGSVPELETFFGEVGKNWGWMLALGIVFIVLGTIGLGMPVVLTGVSILFLGALLLVGGGVQLIDAFKCKGWKSVIWHVLIALLYLAAGAVMVYEPLQSALPLTAMLGGVLLGVGVLRIIMGFQQKGEKGWGWLVFAGIISLVLGGIILAQWPVSGLWVIGLFVA